MVCPRFIGWISSYEPDSLLAAINNHRTSTTADDDDDTKTNENADPIRHDFCGNKQHQPIAHISPYSFFIDVARGSRPMVAFAACPRSDEFDDSEEEEIDGGDDGDYGSGTDREQPHKKNKTEKRGGGGSIGSHWKDAQRDAEQTGVFCVNIVSQDLAWAMNASAAPLGKGLSEFRLMEGADAGDCMDDGEVDNEDVTNGEGRLGDGDAKNQRQSTPPKTIPTPIPSPSPDIPAPVVPQSPIIMECRYVSTVKIPDIFKGDSMYSLIIGEVVNIHIREDVLLPEADVENDVHLGEKFGRTKSAVGVDIRKVRPVARLGYGQEYTVVSEYLES